MSIPTALVADRYRLVRMLGAGGMGIVWEAWDEKLHRTVAIKMLRTQPELTDAERQDATDRAMREARITAGLHHPHAVTVFDVTEHDGQPCIVMQLIESTPLSVLLREHGTFSPAETARVGAQVASALAAAHKLRIVHRDVKPGNILIGADGSAMISDFGISHALGDTTITATGLVHGTPAYLAPEAARGLPMGFASDVFSLGSTLYAMTEGQPPFGTEPNAIALLHKVSRGGFPAPKHAGPLAPLLRRMLATQPKRRPSMAEVVESLSALEQGPVAVPAAVLASSAPVPEDWTTERIETPPLPPEPTAETTAETKRLDAPPEPEAASTTAATEPLAGTAATDPAAALAALAATAATEPLAGPAPAVVTQREVVARPAGPPPQKRSSRRAWIAVAVIVLLAAFGVGAWLLTDALRTPPAAQAPAPTTSAPPASPTPAESPTAQDPAPSATTPPAEQQPQPQPSAETPEQRVTDAIAGYYALMPGQRDSAWPLMTADYQENHAGGRGGYEAFWSGVDAVSVTDISAQGADRGQATLTYSFHDGRTVEEVTSYRFVDEGGVLKIAGTDVLSSTQR